MLGEEAVGGRSNRSDRLHSVLCQNTSKSAYKLDLNGAKTTSHMVYSENSSPASCLPDA